MKILEVIQQAKEKGYTHVDAHGNAMLATIADFEQDVIKRDKFYSPLYTRTYNNIEDGGRVYAIGDDYPSMIFEKRG